MKFLYTYACLILLCSTIGNCGDLPQTNEALRARYETKNNGLTQDKIADFLFEAIRLNDPEMVKTIKNPPLQKRTIGDKTNPILSQQDVSRVIKKVEDTAANTDLLGIDGYLQASEGDEITQEKINALFVKISRKGLTFDVRRGFDIDSDWDDRNSTKLCTLILGQAIKPDQAATNSAFYHSSIKNSTDMCALILQQAIKPDQDQMNKAFIECAAKNTTDMCRLILQQEIKPDQDAMNKAFIKFAAKNNADMCTLLLQQAIKPDADGIKTAFDFAAQNDQDDMFTLLASEVQPQDIQAAAKLAGKNGSAKVLKKILTEHSPSQDTVSQALKETAKAFTKFWKGPKPADDSGKEKRAAKIKGFEGCCTLILQNTNQLPDAASITVAKDEECPRPKNKTNAQ